MSPQAKRVWLGQADRFRWNSVDYRIRLRRRQDIVIVLKVERLHAAPAALADDLDNDVPGVSEYVADA